MGSHPNLQLKNLASPQGAYKIFWLGGLHATRNNRNAQEIDAKSRTIYS